MNSPEYASNEHTTINCAANAVDVVLSPLPSTQQVENHSLDVVSIRETSSKTP